MDCFAHDPIWPLRRVNGSINFVVSWVVGWGGGLWVCRRLRGERRRAGERVVWRMDGGGWQG